LDIFNDDYERHHDQLEQTLDDHCLALLLSDRILNEIVIFSVKLKQSIYMSRIDRTKLKYDMNDEQIPEEEERIWRDLVFGRLTVYANVCEISLNIMTIYDMPREILLEHVFKHPTLII
jgi:hypothetical protein